MTLAGVKDDDTAPVGTVSDAEEKPASLWWRGLPIAAALYLLGSLILWSKVWTGHPTSTTNPTSNDTSAFIWFLEWPAYAVQHGKSLFYSTALFHPHGINLLANTGVLTIGVVMLPVTWLFGPVASLNVAMTLAPVLSALGLFVLLRRWVTWLPAAFVGGLLYGFCPFILQSLTEGQLHQGVLILPPLIVLCLDEILFRQHFRTWIVGVVMGLLVALQFFIGTEILFMFGFVSAACLVIVALYWWRQKDRSLLQFRRACTGLVAGGATSVVLLAYPVWFALAGPAHLGGRVWPLPLPYYGNSVSDLFNPIHGTSTPIFGAGFTRSFIGIGLVVVCVAGLVVWRRDQKLQIAALGAGVSLVLSLGASHSVLLPWKAFGNLPLLENIIPSRFSMVAYLALAVMLGLIVDHTWVAAGKWEARAASQRASSVDARPAAGARLLAPFAALLVAAVALVPFAVYLEPYVPFAVRPVAVPDWFQKVGVELPGRQVVLVLPMPYFLENPLTWQAVDHMRFDLVSGVGPEGDPSRGGVNAGAQEFLDSLSAPEVIGPKVTPEAISSVRDTMDRWGVTTVVIPTDGKPPTYLWRVNSVPLSVAFMTAVTGTRPVEQDHAWVWYGLGTAPPPLILSTAAFEKCATPAILDPSKPIGPVVDCLLAPTAP
jgi:hypothetical protein